MKTRQQIAAARNVLLRALVEDAKDKDIFSSAPDLFEAVMQMGVFNWLFGDDGAEADCPHHSAPTFGHKLAMLEGILEEKAGCSDPESGGLYLEIKNRMRADDLSMWDVLREIASVADGEQPKAVGN